MVCQVCTKSLILIVGWHTIENFNKSIIHSNSKSNNHFLFFKQFFTFMSFLKRIDNKSIF